MNSKVVSNCNYAPSIPLHIKDNPVSAKKLTELLMRSKSGMNNDDLQK
jgi:hypothetical protein